MRRLRSKAHLAFVFVIISALILQFALAPVAGACTPPDEPFNIESLGVFGETTAPEAVDVVGTTAYVADDDGLSIYDVTDPAAASFLGDHAIVGGAMDVFVSGTVAYVGGEDGKVYIVDVTTPATPAPLDILNAGSPVVRLFAEGARLVVAADDGIHIYDVTDPSSPVADGFISTPEPVSDVLVDGDVLYAVYSYYTVSGVSVQCVPSNLMAIDISGGTPTELARHEIPYGHVSLGLYGDLLFVAISHPDGGGSGVKVFDVANPDELDFITYVGVASYGALDIAMDGAFVYLAGLKSTWLWHFNDLAVPYLAGLHTDPNYRLDFEGGYLFGTNPDVGVSVYGYTGESVRSLGASRYDTAIDVSKNFASADWVVIATGANYPDALAGAPLAYELGGPILLSHPKNGLSAAAKTEVDRLGATHALILGGTGVVPSVVSSQLAAAGVPAGNIARIAGTNRYDTSAKIAARLKAELGGGAVTEAFIATGENFPDALAASGLAAKMGAPVLLVQTGSIPSQTAGALAALGVTDTIVLGGTSAVSATVYNRLPSPMRLAGTNRFATAAAVASWALDGSGAGFAPDQVIVATGSNFPDALSSGVLGAAKSSATVLVNTDVPGETRNFLATRASGIDGLYVIGGPGAVSVEVERVCVSLIK